MCRRQWKPLGKAFELLSSLGHSIGVGPSTGALESLRVPHHPAQATNAFTTTAPARDTTTGVTQINTNTNAGTTRTTP
jgi:hypothetical protein